MNNNEDFVFIEEKVKDEIVMGGGIVPSLNLPIPVDENQDNGLSNIVSDEKLVFTMRF
mgnify:CR=1 FL=1